jgi:tetratricopeptide (TPR) repeat protein
MNNLAYTYCEMGQKLDEAVALCQRAATVLPARKAYFLDTLGTVYLKQGKRNEAVAAFEAALAAATERERALRNAIQQHLKAAQSR